MTRRPNSREDILDAAEAVVCELGAAHLTLDAVADRAGISKGGLLYNFPSKQDLLKSMLARLLDRCAADRAQARSEDLSDPAADLKAHILTGFRHAADPQRVSSALLAAGAADPRLLAPVRSWHEKNFRELSANKRHPLRILILMLAMDGLWLNELLQTAPFGPESRDALMQEMFALADSVV